MLEGSGSTLPPGRYDERLGNSKRTKRGIKLTRLTVHRTSPVTTASSLTVAVKAITAPVTYALARTTVRLAFRPKSIAVAPRITCATAVASQAIALRTTLTSLTLTHLTPVVA